MGVDILLLQNSRYLGSLQSSDLHDHSLFHKNNKETNVKPP